MKIQILSVLLVLATPILADNPAPSPSSDPPMNSKPEKATFTLSPIGRVERQENRTVIRLEPRYQDGLLGLEQWSHIWVFYWFDGNDTPEKRAVLRVHPRGNRENPLTGVFATRSPMRPNLIALSLCRVVSIKNHVIEIESIDAFDNTPVIDIKPYTAGIDAPKGSQSTPAWAAGRAK